MKCSLRTSTGLVWLLSPGSNPIRSKSSNPTLPLNLGWFVPGGFNEDLAGGKQKIFSLVSEVMGAGFITMKMISNVHIHFEFSACSYQIDSFISADFVSGKDFSHVFQYEARKLRAPKFICLEQCIKKQHRNSWGFFLLHGVQNNLGSSNPHQEENNMEIKCMASAPWQFLTLADVDGNQMDQCTWEQSLGAVCALSPTKPQARTTLGCLFFEVQPVGITQLIFNRC